MKASTRSPIKDHPLRLPGQSVAEEREELVENAVGQPLYFALFLVLLAAFEWWRFYSDAKPNPIVYSVAALMAICYAVFRIVRARPRLRNLRQALAGERVVGQFLERLREMGFHVYHDVVGSGFNIDHVLVGPAGVFTIETKTWSKPAKGKASIQFDGNAIRIGSVEPDRDPVAQAKAQASWLKSVLLESSGRKADVRPVILFPGWFIESTPGSFREVWVLEPKALPAFLVNEPTRLAPEEVKLLSFHLSRMIRTSNPTTKNPA